MPELILYTNPMSRGRIARWMLEEVGEPYEARILPFGPPMKTPEYLAVNPMGKVPSLVHGETVVTEVGAICAYLADAFPDAGLAPSAASPERGAYYRWLFFAAGPLEAAVTNTSLGWHDPERSGMLGYGSMAQVLDLLETHLGDGRAFAVGDAFGAVDVLLGSQLGFGLRFGTIEARPAFEAYVERVTGRPAAVRAGTTDDALLAEAQAGSEA